MMSPTVIRPEVMDALSLLGNKDPLALLGNKDPLAASPAAAPAVGQRAAQAGRGLADLVRAPACGADEQLAAALGQAPLGPVDVGPAAVRALHRDGRPEPGDDERRRARPGQQAGRV